MTHFSMNGLRGHNQDVCLVNRFAALVRSQPSAIVALCGDDSLTLAQLGASATTVARDIAGQGAGIVGVFAYPGFALLSGMWGSMLAGSAYCPLSPDYPEDRIRFMVQSAGIAVIVCEPGLEDVLRCIVGSQIRIVVPGFQADAPRDISPADVSSDDLAYVIFTSGSTGRPKGVMIEHGNIASQMDWFDQTFGLGAGTRILQKTPYSFDAAQWELLASAYGATLVFGSREGYRNPFEQINLIKAHGVTMLQCVPTLWRGLLETEQLAGCTSLRTIFSGGEALSRELARDCIDALPKARLINLYGPTECTINAASYHVTRAWIERGDTTVPIGHPVGSTQISVRAAQGMDVAPGTSGEIYISGAQVGRGYLGNAEATAESFVQPDGATTRYYRTGDIGKQNEDGSFQFMSRKDGQIKLRGYRIEVDEIRNAIENHDWVKAAGVFVARNAHTNTDALVACVELSPNQAQLMDASTAGDHHKSKGSKLQVKAQMSGLGLRQPGELVGTTRIALPRRGADQALQAMAFARKSYRHFEGPRRITADQISALLADQTVSPATGRTDPVDLDALGSALRSFGQFQSADRLLPKYAYASPGALYATQIYLSISGIKAIESGLYYYHPVQHALHRVAATSESADQRLAMHFVGKSRAISHVYKLNLREVLDFEVGHILGLCDRVLPSIGLAVGSPCDDTDIMHMTGAENGDFYLGGFTLTDCPGEAWGGPEVTAYVQSHGDRVSGLGPGLHKAGASGFLRRSKDRIEKNHVIAINQQVYERASFGIGLCAIGVEDSLAYVALGRALQKMQMNDRGFGFMSSGYSSRSGEDQRAASRFFDIMGSRNGAFYFCVGGRVSAAQIAHRGMKEDMVHSKGPMEMIRDDLKAQLPDYMVPSHVALLDTMPLSANGKVDMARVRDLVDLETIFARRDVVPPRTATEREVARQWTKVTGIEDVSVTESFFSVGGDSLGAVKLVMLLNEAFGVDLPLEAIFDADTVEALAASIVRMGDDISCRIVQLSPGTGDPVFCWPGLGGYPMGLRDLAKQLSAAGRPVYGVQAFGLNAEQTPDGSIDAMAARDLEEIRKLQPEGPYTMIGYSFGARVAHAAALQVEDSGDAVENLILVAPGSPKLSFAQRRAAEREVSFANPEYAAVLLSVFTRHMGGPELEGCLATVRDRAAFIAYASGIARDMPVEVVTRIADVAMTCLALTYEKMTAPVRLPNAPLVVIRASGDEDSFIENCGVLQGRLPYYCDLPCDHFRLLMRDGVDMLGRHIVSHLNLQAQTRQAA